MFSLLAVFCQVLKFDFYHGLLSSLNRSKLSHRLVVKGPELLDGEEAAHDEPVHDEELDEVGALHDEGAEHDLAEGVLVVQRVWEGQKNAG